MENDLSSLKIYFELVQHCLFTREIVWARLPSFIKPNNARIPCSAHWAHDFLQSCPITAYIFLLLNVQHAKVNVLFVKQLWHLIKSNFVVALKLQIKMTLTQNSSWHKNQPDSVEKKSKIYLKLKQCYWTGLKVKVDLEKTKVKDCTTHRMCISILFHRHHVWVQIFSASMCIAGSMPSLSHGFENYFCPDARPSMRVLDTRRYEPGWWWWWDWSWWGLAAL